MLSNEEIVDLLKKIKSLSNSRLKTKSINVGTFKVNCEWTAEMVSEIKKMSNIDAEEELRVILNGEINTEIIKSSLKNKNYFKYD
jgi:hypothetical protein